MSQRGGRPIDFQAWAQNQIVKRAVAALEARDEAFAERNADTPLPQLARYLSRCAISLGHSPSPSEVDGGTFIEQRFGSWAAAMAAARLPQPVWRQGSCVDFVAGLSCQFCGKACRANLLPATVPILQPVCSSRFGGRLCRDLHEADLLCFT